MKNWCWHLQNNRRGVVEESEAMQPSVKNVSLIGIRRTVKAESEQPSPVSILDFPYDDEALLSRENKEIKPDLQGDECLTLQPSPAIYSSYLHDVITNLTSEEYVATPKCTYFNMI
jgi:hypothetical protein